jgi:hypothetical protein
MRFLLRAIPALFLLACSSTNVPVGTLAPSPTVIPSVQVATVPPTIASTPQPTAMPTPESKADVVITHQLLKAWKDSISYVHYEVVVEVQNVGTAPADVATSDDSYTIFAKDGTVLETGHFTYVFPQVIRPGEFAYYVDGSIFDQGTLTDQVGKLDPSVSFGEADSPQTLFKVSSVKITQQPYGSGLQVSGVVTNSTSEDAAQPLVGVIFFNAKGAIIGALYENSLDTLRAGKSLGFKTSYPGTSPLKPSSVAKFKTFAFDYSFF